MSYDDAIKALSKDALKLVKNNQIVGLGSGRAATALVKSLSSYGISFDASEFLQKGFCVDESTSKCTLVCVFLLHQGY